MFRVLFLIILVAALGASVLAQPANKAILLTYVEPGNEDLEEAFYRVGEVGANYLKAEDGVIAIRVCSDDPLAVSSVNSPGNAHSAVARLVKNNSIPVSKILFLRQNKGCKFFKNDYVYTEYWYIPGSVELPSYVEIRRASDILEIQLTRSDFRVNLDKAVPLTPQEYTQVLEELVEKMKQEKTTFVVIQVPLDRGKTPSALALRGLEVEKYLKDRGISSYRIYLSKLSSMPKEIPSGTRSYPNIVLTSERHFLID